MHSLRWTLVAVLSGLGVSSAAADDPALKSSPEQRLAFARSAAAAYHFRVGQGSGPKVTLERQPLLRWINKVVREDDGMLFLWTEGPNGRPVAAAQFFLVGPVWNHEFQSLSPEPFEARSEGAGLDGWTWQPARPGLTFQRAEDNGPPADSGPQRLRQMKAIAERFTGAVDTAGTFENPEQLRLLTTPVYRYSDPARGIVDGAMFAFVQGTNPEVLLLIEADATSSGAKSWRFGFARMSCFYLRVHQGPRLVWSADREPVPTPDPSAPYFFRPSAQPDRSAALGAGSDG